MYPSQSVKLGGIDVWINAVEVHAEAKECSDAMPTPEVAAFALREAARPLHFRGI